MFRTLKKRLRTARAEVEIATRRLSPRAHGLDTPLVVSLTSYPARFPTLERTLKGITRQTVRPDHVVLWLAHGDAAALPPAIRTLAEVRETEDTRSYKKIIPCLSAFPEATIVTADDDVYYHSDWLEGLVEARAADGGAVICHRAHRITRDATGHPRPYREWEWGVTGPIRSPLLFPTGCSGVMYAPGAFHPDVTRADIFTELSPTADDVWLYWMFRMAGHAALKSAQHRRVLEWWDSQATNLRGTNLRQGGNDTAIAAMVARYGFPSSEG